MAAGDGSRRVYLHVGPPKTGTTYLQSVLKANKRRLRQAGVLVPGRGESPHFEAAADLRGRRRKRGKQYRKGAWDDLAAEVRQWPGTSVVSCEWLAFCDDDQVARAARSLAGVERHVVVTLRDLGRVVPAVWQEQVKNGKDFTMTEFLRQLGDPEHESYGQLFWSVHDTRALLGRWAGALRPERVHVVTLPGAGAPPDELWRRFGGLFLDDPGAFDTTGVRANPGLDPAEAELLRRVNAELGGRMRKAAHGPLVKQFLHEELTSHQGAGGRVRLPTPALESIAGRAGDVVGELRAAGYDVVGSLDELGVDGGSGSTALPEDSADGDVARAAVTSMAALLLTMQADGAHRRRPWKHSVDGRLTKKGRERRGKRAGAAAALPEPGAVATGRRALGRARRAAGRVRRAARG